MGVNDVQLKPGKRLWSQTSSAAVIVVRAPAVDSAELWCGGQPMAAEVPTTPSTALSKETATERIELGKRYTDAEGQLELVCTSAGAGPLTLDGRVLGIKPARNLPASD
jgi:hypothetical protein